MPNIASRIGHVAAQRYRIAEALHNGEHGNDVSVLYPLRSFGSRIHILDAAHAVLVNALQPDAAFTGHGCFATCQLNEIFDRRRAFQLINAGGVHTAADGRLWTDEGDEDDVAGNKADIVAFVSAQQQVIQIEVHQRFAVALHLNVAQRPVRQWSARGEDRVQQGAERGDGVAARAARLTDNEDLNGAQRSQVRIYREIPIQTRELGVQKAVQFTGRNAGKVHSPQSGHTDNARAVYGKIELLVDLAGKLNSNLIPRPDHVIGAHRNIGHGSKGAWDVGEERSAEDGQNATSRSRHKLLKLGHLIRQQVVLLIESVAGVSGIARSLILRPGAARVQTGTIRLDAARTPACRGGGSSRLYRWHRDLCRCRDCGSWSRRRRSGNGGLRKGVRAAGPRSKHAEQKKGGAMPSHALPAKPTLKPQTIGKKCIHAETILIEEHSHAGIASRREFIGSLPQNFSPRYSCLVYITTLRHAGACAEGPQ